jgi:hypothetical protein
MVRDIPRLSRVHFQNCRLYEDRREMLVAVPKGGRGAEIGVFRGDWSAILLQDLQPSKLYLIDIEFATDPAVRFAKEMRSGVVEAVRGDSAKVMERFEDRSFDWLYIDGDHSPDGVKRDVAVCKRKIKPDGLLMFNDYKMVDHNYPDGLYEYGIIHEVNRLCIEEGWEMIAFAFHQQMYCDVMLRMRR